MKRRVLDAKKATKLTRRIRAKKTVATHVVGIDVVVGPLDGSNWIEQHKFESANAEALLNGPNTQRRVV